MFLAPWFAWAALVAAAGPVLIHLLNRRRFRVVEWAAMDFLRQAVQRSRRVLRLRDWLLLLLRTACVLLFGLALARPYLSRATAALSADQPVHGVVLVDNSLSMSYEELDGTLLDAAKHKARQWIERQPSGSRFSILPLCGAVAGLNLDPLPTRDEALEALAAIQTVDRAATPAGAVQLAHEACRRAAELPAKQIVLLGDAQVTGRPPESLGPQLARLPVPVQTIRVAADAADNAWVERFELQDQIAEVATPAVFLATVRYQGRQPRRDVQVALSLDGVTVASTTVDLEPGQAREIRFPPYRFTVAPEPGRAAFVRAAVGLTPDRLPADDRRFRVVPVVAGLPVVFVDQYGASEDPRRNRYGETYYLRRLLAPHTAVDEAVGQWIRVRHVTAEAVDCALLADARLVVVAGVANPRPLVDPLRQYVEQGGPVLLAAGGQFDPIAWNELAWLEGQGILPAPLKPEFVGRLADAPGDKLQTFQIDFQSLVHDWFLLEQVSAEELEDLYRLPYFFQAAALESTDRWLDVLLRRATRQMERDRARLAELDVQLSKLPAGDASGRREQLERDRAAVEPNWLRWRMPPAVADAVPPPVEELAERQRPRVVAALTNGVPLLVERRIGAGRVLWFSSGLSTNWSTLALTNTMLLLDRICRDLLQGTFPRRNLDTNEPIALPVSAADRSARFVLNGGEARPQVLAADAVGPDRYAVTAANPARRGHYQLTAMAAAAGGRESQLWEVPLAVNGPAEESDLRGPAADRVKPDAAEGLWVADRAENAQEASAAGQYLWRWFMLAALVCLLAEVALLAGPRVGREVRT
jgi:hypothetical protein